MIFLQFCSWEKSPRQSSRRSSLSHIRSLFIFAPILSSFFGKSERRYANAERIPGASASKLATADEEITRGSRQIVSYLHTGGLTTFSSFYFDGGCCSCRTRSRCKLKAAPLFWFFSLLIKKTTDEEPSTKRGFRLFSRARELLFVRSRTPTKKTEGQPS